MLLLLLYALLSSFGVVTLHFINFLRMRLENLILHREELHASDDIRSSDVITSTTDSTCVENLIFSVIF